MTLSSAFERHLFRVKFAFSVLITLTLIALLWGSLALRRNHIFAGNPFLAAIATWRYRLEYYGHPLALVPDWRQWLVAEESYQAPEITAAAVPVLVYHNINDDEVESTTNISVDHFKEQLFALKRAGYETISVEQLYRFLRGEATLPARSIMITFDDGIADSFYYADPVLRALSYEAVMFALPKYSVEATSTSYYLTTHQLQAMESSGRWDIQSHGYDAHTSLPIAADSEGNFYSHRLINPSSGQLETQDEYRDRVRQDLIRSRDSLAEVLSREVVAIAYPFGDYGQGSTNLESAADIVLAQTEEVYRLAFVQHIPERRFRANYTEAEASRRFYLTSRIIVDSGWSGQQLLSVLESVAPKSLPYHDELNDDRGWVSTWGRYSIGGGKMQLRSVPGDTGAAVILDGSRPWHNYEVRAQVQASAGDSVVVWVRFADDRNNASCNFGHGFTHVEQVVDGVGRVIQGSRRSDMTIPGEQFAVAVRVQGRTVECYLNGQLRARSDFLAAELDQGGVGFKVWAMAGSAMLSVNDVVVRELVSVRSS